jgi:hypothetical protein
MRQRNNHSRLVDQWASWIFETKSSADIVQIFNSTFSKVWNSAQLTLGSVTLQAVTERVMSVTKDEFIWLPPLHSEGHGVNFQNFSEDGYPVSRDELIRGLSFLMTELITVLGSITGEVISKKLHSSLMESISDGQKDSITGNGIKDSEQSLVKGGK